MLFFVIYFNAHSLYKLFFTQSYNFAFILENSGFPGVLKAKYLTKFAPFSVHSSVVISCINPL